MDLPVFLNMVEQLVVYGYVCVCVVRQERMN